MEEDASTRLAACGESSTPASGAQVTPSACEEPGPHGSGTRTFVITGNPEAACLDVLRHELTRRGWVETANEDTCDLIWGPRHKVDYDKLRPNQRTNHFEFDPAITTKSGILQSLQDGWWCADMDSASFHPMAFTLSSSKGIKEFECQFKVSKALCVLKAWLRHVDSGKSFSKTFPSTVVLTSLNIVNRWTLDVDSVLDGASNEAEVASVSVEDVEWEVLEQVDFNAPSAPNSAGERLKAERQKKKALKRVTKELQEKQKKALEAQAEKRRQQQESLAWEQAKRQAPAMRRKTLSASSLGAVLNASDLEKPHHEHSPFGGWAATLAPPDSSSRGCDEAVSSQVAERRGGGLSPSATIRLPPASPSSSANGGDGEAGAVSSAAGPGVGGERLTGPAAGEEGANEEVSSAALVPDVRRVLLKAKKDPQFALHVKNVWIAKPIDAIRGRGIFVDDNLERILWKVRRQSIVHSGFVVQKYIESPLLVGGSRKHDIRQWVFVSCLNPLTIWFYSECYAKVSANDFVLDSFDDNMTHLTHTVIMRNHPQYDVNDDFWRCQWSQKTYRKILKQSFGKDVWAETIRPQMQKIAVASLQCVQENFAVSKSADSCFQLFGYDFMVDADLNVWLLEVNGIPGLQGKTSVDGRLVNAILGDVVALAGDGITNDDAELRWEFLYRGPVVPRSLRTDAGHNLSVQGVRLERPTQSAGVCGDEGAREATLKLKKRREQELQQLLEKKRCEQELKREDAERKLRLQRSLANKVLKRRSSSMPQLPSLLDSSPAPQAKCAAAA